MIPKSDCAILIFAVAGIVIILSLVIFTGMQNAEQIIEYDEIINEAECDELATIKNEYGDQLFDPNYRTMTNKLIDCMVGDKTP